MSNTKKGFTLIEIIVALAVLVIVVAIVSTAFSLYGRVNGSANKNIQAQEIAVNAVEELLYTAKTESKGKESLISNLETSDTFGVFSVIDANTLSFDKGTYVITLQFSRENKLIYLKVTLKDGQHYETTEWLTYGKT